MGEEERREIKFRAWRVDKKWMLYPGMLFDVEGLSYIISIEILSDRSWDITAMLGETSFYWGGNEKDVLMQYTGVKDRNGVEIYEGDIIENKVYGGRGYVRWGVEKEEYAGWSITWKAKDREEANLLYFENFKNCEVVGNIYANPELIT